MTTNRPQIDHKSTTNRPQNDHKMTTNRPQIDHKMTFSLFRHSSPWEMGMLSVVRGVDFKPNGWFLVDRRTTHSECAQDIKTSTDVVSVCCREKQRQWPKSRQGWCIVGAGTTGNPILGDSEHGNSKVYREWKSKHGLLPERICLHLCRAWQSPTENCHEKPAFSRFASDSTRSFQERIGRGRVYIDGRGHSDIEPTLRGFNHAILGHHALEKNDLFVVEDQLILSRLILCPFAVYECLPCKVN